MIVRAHLRGELDSKSKTRELPRQEEDRPNSKDGRDERLCRRDHEASEQEEEKAKGSCTLAAIASPAGLTEIYPWTNAHL